MNKKIIFNLVLTVIIIGLIFIAAAFLNPREGDDTGKNSAEVVNIELEGDINENQEQSEKVFALMKTNFGNIKLELFPNDAPNTVQNFIDLSESDFYNQVKFHRVIKDFMIQAGDPNSKDDNWSDDGRGGPGYTFDDEINSHKLVKGSLAMANSGPNTNGSQFFIVTADSTPWLDGKHTVFGKVAEGMETVLKIENVETDKSAGDHPIADVIIKGVEIIK